ncbi:amidohydrolase [Thalassomonas sp. M1454]|uniref:amidohydrolase n=1 Tax=Thalassomonas sp. M1454 TaxID=2594477 RepID=UPI0011802B5A|nr:amidohydrolase [Thalassomonas sp. M1454]TRX55696.1 amidohydrolase [Thalassomonas sp. M1454]
MKHLKITSAIIATLLSPNLLAATTLIENIQGYSHNGEQLQQFKAVQFSDDKIDKVFFSSDKLPTNSDIKRIDGQGKTLLPGLIDAHGHVLSYGLSLTSAELYSTSSEQDAVQQVVEFNKANPSNGWIKGRGWNQVQWQNKQFPTAKSLDKYFKDTPVVLDRVDGHALWVNSKTLELAGINKDTKEVDGGQIIRDEQGNPTGVLVDNAMNLVFAKIPALTPQQTKEALSLAMKSLAKVGLTSVHDAGIETANIDAFKAMSANDEMLIRINAMLGAWDPEFSKQLAKGHFNSEDDMLLINSVKISADGALGSRGAALIEDYSDMPHHKGLLLYSNEELTAVMKQSMQAGFQVNTHAIGDNANKIVIDNYEQLIKQTKTKDLRHRVEHAQILQLSDIPRFHQLGIIASMQATHATSDKNMAEDRVGSERIKGAYAWRSLLEAKAVIAAGSDFPVEYPNPFFGLHSSVTRQDQQNQPENGWYSNEAMTIAEAFKSFTIDAAYAGHQEKIIGSIETGKKADFILIDQNIFTIDAKEIWKTKVINTWVNGKKVEF